MAGQSGKCGWGSRVGWRSLALAATLAALPLMATGATAHWVSPYGVTGNDTGGIIPWSPEIRRTYRAIAAAHCAQYNKHARITSVHAWYGDFVAFRCRWDRHYDPVKDEVYGRALRVRG